MSELQDNALLLRLIPFSDSSLIAHLLTEHHGRICVLARGARRIKSPFRASLLQLQQLNIRWKEPRTGTMGTLLESTRLKSLVDEKQSLSWQSLLAKASTLFPDGVSQGYHELFDAFTLLQNRPEDSGLNAACWQLFEDAGLVGDLESCWHCGESIAILPLSYWFNGHLLCDKCSNKHGMAISLGLKKAIREHMKNPNCKLSREQTMSWSHMIKQVEQFHKH